MRLLLFIPAFLLFSSRCRAQCLSGDCSNGIGKMDMGYGVYEGFFKSGKPDGAGTMDYGGGDKYAGIWREGKEDGPGTLYKKGVETAVVYRNGQLQAAPRAATVVRGNRELNEKVPGCTAGDCRNGYGEIGFSSGNRYKGGFKYGVKHGQGEMTFASGNIFRGEFVANDAVRGTFFYADVNTLFTGTVNADATPKTGTYTSPGMDAIVDVTDGRVTGERHPVRDSLNALARKHAQEHAACPACQGKGEYLNTTWSSIKSTRTEGSTWTPTGGNATRVEYKTTGGFSQNMVKCKACGGTGEVKRK